MERFTRHWEEERGWRSRDSGAPADAAWSEPPGPWGPGGLCLDLRGARGLVFAVRRLTTRCTHKLFLPGHAGDQIMKRSTFFAAIGSIFMLFGAQSAFAVDDCVRLGGAIVAGECR